MDSDLEAASDAEDSEPAPLIEADFFIEAANEQDEANLATLRKFLPQKDLIGAVQALCKIKMSGQRITEQACDAVVENMSLHPYSDVMDTLFFKVPHWLRTETDADLGRLATLLERLFQIWTDKVQNLYFALCILSSCHSDY